MEEKLDASSRKKYRLRRRLFNALMGSPKESGCHHHHEHEHECADPGCVSDEMAQLAQQVQEVQETALRARADLENQRKRHMKEKEELRKFANESLLNDLVPALDHFALALRSLDAAADVESVRQGIQMIHREFISVLQNNGLAEISPLGQPFDPVRHEAVSTGAAAEHADNAVIEVMRPGWELNGRVLRPAMVKVNKAA